MEDLKTSETWRVFRIQSELVDGFETLHALGPAVTIFGSSRLSEDSSYYKEAGIVARKLADDGFVVGAACAQSLFQLLARGRQNKDANGLRHLRLDLARTLPVDFENDVFTAGEQCFGRAARGAVKVIEYLGMLEKFVISGHLTETLQRNEVISLAVHFHSIKFCFITFRGGLIGVDLTFNFFSHDRI